MGFFIKRNNISHYFIATIGLALAIYFQSRAFIFGFTLALLFVYVVLNKKPKKSFLYASICAIILLFTLIFCFKKNSSNGRILIYKVSTELLKENWLTGIGLGNFKTYYLPKQAHYFANHNYSPSEFLLADNTYYAFNDYYQFIIETGIIGVLIVVIFLFLIFKLIKKAVEITPINPVVIANCTLLIAILTAAFFSHVFEKLVFQVLLFITVISLLYFVVLKNSVAYKLLHLSAIIIVFAYITLQFKSFQLTKNYNKAITLYMVGYRHKSIIELKKIWPIADEKRLLLYTQLLLESFAITQEIEILTAMQKIPSASNYKLLGDYYLENKEFKKAETAYQTAIDMVPNRFIPRRSLYKLYLITNQKLKAVQAAKEIIAMPIKIPSYQIKKIKNEAKHVIQFN